MDCLIAHIPKMLEWSPTFGWTSRIDFMSMGTLALAEELDRAGLSCRVVHVGVEKQLDPSFSLTQYVRTHQVRVLALALHWHPQTYDVLEAARQLKAAEPGLFLVLGGLTATCFAAEILAEHPAVDAVIRGEAERPLRQLVEGQPLGAVENLSWRDGAEIRHNPVTFLTSGADMDALTFGAWHLVEHAAQCLSQSWRHLWDPRLRGRLAPPVEPTLFGAALGRGCLGTCTWCAGSYGAMRATTGRRKTAWRAAERVAETFEAARSAGAKRIYTCFDPHPRRAEQILTLLEVLGQLSPRVPLDFECFGLPSEQVVRAFHHNLDPSSTLIVSPECADEAARKRHRAFPFSNADLFATLTLMGQLGMKTDLYYIIGLPGEDRSGVAATRDLQDDLKARFTSVRRQFTWPLEMEPGAPWHRDPEAHGLTLRHRALADFYEAHRQPEFSLGYDTATLTEAEILSLYRDWFLRVPEGVARALAAYLREFGAPPPLARVF